MSIIGAVIAAVILVVAVAAYQLYAAHKAVTAANLLAQAKADEAVAAAKAAADVAVVKSDVQKL